MPDLEYDATGRMVRNWANDLIPVPKHKPTTGIEPPDYRKDVFNGPRRVEWDDWSRHVQTDSELSNAEKKAYHDIFAAEGGMRQAPGGTAVAGILKGTLNDIASANKIDRVVRKHKDLSPSVLDYGDVKDVYKGIFDIHFDEAGKKIGMTGSKMLTFFNDDPLSSAVADVVFRDGIGDAGMFIHIAIKKSDPLLKFKEDNILGGETFKNVKGLIQDPQKRRVFLDVLADQRRPYERDRNDYFRFKD